MCGNAVQQCGEVVAFGLVEWFQRRRFQLVGHSFGRGQDAARPIGEVEGVRASVDRVAGALDQAADLEVIDEADHRVAMDVEQVGQLLLAAAVRVAKVGQDPEVGRV